MLSADFATLITLVFASSIIGLGFAVWLARWVLAKDTGTPAMRKISDAIKQGAEAFLRRQNLTILSLSGLFALILFVGYGILRAHREFDPVSSALQLASWITVSFVLGALCSVCAGYIGMWVSIRANIRTAAAACISLNDALQVSLRAGGVSGMVVVAMSLLGVAGLFALVKLLSPDINLTKIPLLIVLAHLSWPCSLRSAAAFTPKPPMSVPIWLARSKLAFLKTTRVIRQLSPIWLGIMSGIAPGAAQIYSNPPPLKISVQ